MKKRQKVRWRRVVVLGVQEEPEVVVAVLVVFVLGILVFFLWSWFGILCTSQPDTKRRRKCLLFILVFRKLCICVDCALCFAVPTETIGVLSTCAKN